MDTLNKTLLCCWNFLISERRLLENPFCKTCHVKNEQLGGLLSCRFQEIFRFYSFYKPNNSY